MEAKNSYFELYKTDMGKTKAAEEEAKKEAKTFGYDKVFAMYDEKIAGSTKYEDRKVPKKEKRTTVQKSELNGIVTTNQVIGWRQPYDDLSLGNARVGVCKRTFMDTGHL